MNLRCVMPLLLALAAPVRAAAAVAPRMIFPMPAQVRLEGVLGKALVANERGRLRHFILDETSAAVRLFDPKESARNTAGRYWGEHVGKWLCAAARSANRTGDSELAARVRRVADYLVSVQQPDGYIGTYPEALRFMHGAAHPSQGGQWDVWITSYVLLGLMETHRFFPDSRYVAAARRLADLCCLTFLDQGIDITTLGNHKGISATVLLEPMADLYLLTGDQRYAELAVAILNKADARPGFALVKQCREKADLQTIADGKAYQLCWQFTGLAKLYAATGDRSYLEMAEHAWRNIRDNHLTLCGGPWGGVGTASREVFNPRGFFSPYGFVETCSVMAWLQLNRELLSLTAEACYADEIERAVYNSLLGAQDPNGEDWCYYTFPNGRRVYTTTWKCCKSSGALALEEVPPLVAGIVGGSDIAVNLYSPGVCSLRLPLAGEVRVEQITDYPWSGEVRLQVSPERAAEFALRLRIPAWAAGTVLRVNGVTYSGPIVPGSFAIVQRLWRTGDVIDISFPMSPVLHRCSTTSEQDANEIVDGRKVWQEVMHYDYVAITRGPLVYATGLIDGYKREETLRLPTPPAGALEQLDRSEAGGAPSILLHAVGRAPLLFRPYFEAGGRRDGTWRLTWLQVCQD
jgi:DUF1680 family protein